MLKNDQNWEKVVENRLSFGSLRPSCKLTISGTGAGLIFLKPLVDSFLVVSSSLLRTIFEFLIPEKRFSTLSPYLIVSGVCGRESL